MHQGKQKRTDMFERLMDFNIESCRDYLIIISFEPSKSFQITNRKIYVLKNLMRLLKTVI